MLTRFLLKGLVADPEELLAESTMPGEENVTAREVRDFNALIALGRVEPARSWLLAHDHPKPADLQALRDTPFGQALAAFAQLAGGTSLAMQGGRTVPVPAGTAKAADAAVGNSSATAAGQNCQTEKPGGERASSVSEDRWIASHVNLDLLPSAYAVEHHRFDIGDKLNMPPIGVPASRFTLYPEVEFAPTPRTVLALGAATAKRLYLGGSPVYYSAGSSTNSWRRPIACPRWPWADTGWSALTTTAAARLTWWPPGN